MHVVLMQNNYEKLLVENYKISYWNLIISINFFLRIPLISRKLVYII